VFKLRGAHLRIGIDSARGVWGWWVQYEVEIEWSYRDDDELSFMSFMATAKLTQLLNDLVAAMRGGFETISIVRIVSSGHLII
jgi:hypothetical protein